MTAWQRLATAWSLEPMVLGGVALLLGLYLGLVRPPAGRASLFAGGLVVLLLSLVSPLHALADTYLFSAHMLQHMLLTLAVPPLLLLGLPSGPAARSGQTAPGRLARGLARPRWTWLIGTATLWLWHWPPLYDAALGNPGLHAVEHLTLLAAATIFWSPIVNAGRPTPVGWQPALAPWAALLYLGAAAAAGSLLGILLTFAPPGLYPSYLLPDDRLAVLLWLRGELGLTPAADQQLGGLLMWIVGGLCYSAAMLPIIARWLAEPEPTTGGRLDDGGLTREAP